MKLVLKNLLYPLVLDAPVYTLDVGGSTPVQDLLESVSKTISWPTDLITLSHNGRQLEEKHTLDYHTFDVPEATVNLVVKKRMKVLRLNETETPSQN